MVSFLAYSFVCFQKNPKTCETKKNHLYNVLMLISCERCGNLIFSLEVSGEVGSWFLGDGYQHFTFLDWSNLRLMSKRPVNEFKDCWSWWFDDGTVIAGAVDALRELSILLFLHSADNSTLISPAMQITQLSFSLSLFSSRLTVTILERNQMVIWIPKTLMKRL